MDVSVSWCWKRLGRVLLVNLEKELSAIDMYERKRDTHSVSLAPFVPLVAGLRHDVGDVHVVDQVIGAFKYGPDKAGRQMPRDVTVERPDTRVVLVPLQDDV